MPEPIERRCKCGSLLCKVNDKIAIIQCKKGTAEIEPLNRCFSITCICGKRNEIRLEEVVKKGNDSGISGVLVRIPAE